MADIDIIYKLPSVFRGESQKDLDCVIFFNMSRPMALIIKNGEAVVQEGEPEKPTLTLTMKDDFLLTLLSGKVAGMTAVMTGKLKFKGNMALAQKLSKLFDLEKL